MILLLPCTRILDGWGFEQFFFDEVRTESWAGGELEVAVFDFEGMGHEVIAPGGVVDVEFLDIEVGDGGTYVDRDEGVQWAVAVVGRNEGVIGLGKVADFFAHGNAVPGQVGHDDVWCVKVKKGFVAVHTKEAFAGADGGG